MKNTIQYIFATATLLLLNPASVRAEDVHIEPPSGIGPLDTTQLISFVINAFFVIAIIAALFYLLWGGLNWILSGGDKDKIDAARSRIIAAIIGLVLVVLAYFILDFVLRLLTGCGISNIRIPSLKDTGSATVC